jgi:hypothetical protein
MTQLFGLFFVLLLVAAQAQSQLLPLATSMKASSQRRYHGGG